MNTHYAVARLIVQRTELSHQEALELIVKHGLQGPGLFDNADRIINAEAQGFYVELPSEAEQAPGPSIEQYPEAWKLTTKPKHFIQLGSQLIEIDESEVKKAKRDGYTVVMQ